MKKLALLLASAIAFGFSLPVQAEIKVGIISNNKISSFIQEKAESRLSDEFESKFNAIRRAKSELPNRKKYFDILFSHKGRSPTLAEQKEFDLATKKIELELPEKEKKLNEEYRIRKNEENQKATELALKTIADIGKKEDFGQILIYSETAYISPNCGKCSIPDTLDITDKVIKAMSATP